MWKVIASRISVFTFTKTWRSKNHYKISHKKYTKRFTSFTENDIDTKEFLVFRIVIGKSTTDDVILKGNMNFTDRCRWTGRIQIFLNDIICIDKTTVVQLEDVFYYLQERGRHEVEDTILTRRIQIDISTGKENQDTGLKKSWENQVDPRCEVLCSSFESLIFSSDT